MAAAEGGAAAGTFDLGGGGGARGAALGMGEGDDLPKLGEGDDLPKLLPPPPPDLPRGILYCVVLLKLLCIFKITIL